jgi:hypothetical protein
MTTLGQIVGPDVPVILPWSCSVRACCESEVGAYGNRVARAQPFAQRSAQRFAHHSYQPSRWGPSHTRRSFVDRWKR